LPLDQFTPGMIYDNLAAGQAYLNEVAVTYPHVLYPTWIWNYLPPSAASIVHPHTQTLADRDPLPALADLRRHSRDYFARHGSLFWADLVAEERKLDRRFIGENRSLAAVASFAPRGNREVQLVFHEATSLLQLTDQQREDFAESLVGVLHAYHAVGVHSFNVVTYSGPADESSDSFRLSTRIISRPSPAAYYTNDCGFMERFFDAWVIETLPEEVARSVSPYFPRG
jgi:galactose-1-phosphate uridylyltransferase